MNDRDLSKYGDCYWCIKVTEDLSKNGEIYLMADELQVKEGALWCVQKKDEGDQLNLLIAPGKWSAAYAASIIDGHAVAVQHWKGEIEED